MSATTEQIRFRCGRCNRLLGIDARMAGREVKCPQCRRPAVVPSQSETSSDRRASRPDRPRRRYHYRQSNDEAAGEEEFHIARRRGEIDEMDLTPMVDVTFLLLIFFMITASFSLQKSMEVPPPDPQTKGASPMPLEQLEENSVVVQVEPEDVYFVDSEPLDNPEDLALVLSEAMASGNRTELVIEASDQARYESVVRVYDAGNEVGMQRIRLANPVSGS